MRMLLAPVVLAAVALPPLSHSATSPPRWIARADVGLLGLPNSGAKGGGGITVPIDGTGAGFMDAGGFELGVEVRFSRWIAVDAGTGRYWPDLEVYRDRGFGVMVDGRSGSVDLSTYTLGLVVTPPKWRFDKGRIAVGVLAMRAEIPPAPSHLGLSVEESINGVGVDLRAEVFLSASGRWGVGGSLLFGDLEPSFVDDETGATGSLQVSGIFLKLGARRTW